MSTEQLHAPAAAAPVGAQPAPAGGVVNPDRWLEEHRDALFGFALVRVRDQSTAQDLVQETFLAALKAAQNFAGRSSERAWLFGILKNKLADFYRRQSREVPWPDPVASNPEEDAFFHSGGVGKDGWVLKLAPKHWETPEDSLVRQEFQQVFEKCVAGLSERNAQVFLRREIDEASSEEICKEFGISPNNLWILLHRARLALRRCLEAHWFGQKRTESRK